jgi:hypothetical protein
LKSIILIGKQHIFVYLLLGTTATTTIGTTSTAPPPKNIIATLDTSN